MLNFEPRLDLAVDADAIRERVDRRLAQLVPGELVPPKKLHRAIRYSLLAPGKRLRPILMLHAARAFGGCENATLDPACALEMVHAASLIVDDLPFMDDAAERRGMPTNHHAFGMETATLASLALLNRAFSVLADAPGLDSETRNQLVRQLSSALGDCGGAIAGQEEDLEAPDGDDLSIEKLETMVAHKTGALFVAAAEAGALIAGAPAEGVHAARAFGWSFGLCFQALDDLEDRPSRASESGAGLDRDSPAKLTYVSVLGLDAAWQAAQRYAWNAVAALDAVGLGDSSLAGVASNLIGTRRPGRALSGI